jgi:cytochrome c oxidase subunit 1
MPRRTASYLEADNFTTLNAISSAGAMLLGLSTLPFLWNVWITLRKGKPCGPNPWDGHTLEWATPSPPPAGNFVEALPPIRSERPLWDLNHPDHRSPREHGRPAQPSGWTP